ncbi:hypothetical protein PENANT_c002G10419 [Penicillium antarcticum]|uniref:Uncharacterized protein n=1 Tax=Penicillium antarcticum TaxID=416450 RepID=A0A1V6QK64_9EURO|nr:hypothetical protein PENANT_c002G10419 [Penicillium antarcticum]
MTYTVTVIKETLRLYPPSGTARIIPPASGFTIQTPDPNQPKGGEVLRDGLELAESKSAAVLVCVVRRYTWEKVGLGSFEFDGDSPVLGDDGRFRVGEGAYKVLQITANPIDGMKMRVRRTE